MCEQCDEIPFAFPIDKGEFLEHWEGRYEALARLHDSHLTAKDEKSLAFARSLLLQYYTRGWLSEAQWEWVFRLHERFVGTKPLLGNFKAINVMFRMATTTGGMTRPKVRLLTEDGIFVQLNFNVEKPDQVEIFRDGWQGSGKRRFVGWIKDDSIIPYDTSRMTPSILEVIQRLATDPIGTAKAMAALLGCCMWCGSRLSDDESKTRGYGPVCARNYHLPWGDKENTPMTQMELDTLNEFDAMFGGV